MVLIFATWGCKPHDEVRVLQVPKEPRLKLPSSLPATSTTAPAQSEPAEPFAARMLAAIIPHTDRVWFFKMIGASEDVQARRGEFRRLIESITFDDQNEPNWELPETWTEVAGRGMRKATLQAGPSGKAPSISVIGLAAPQEVLPNINRWRDQLQLPPVTEDQLAEYVDTLDVNGHEAILADISGTVDPNAIGAMAGVPPAALQNPHVQPGSGGEAAAGASPLAYEKPASWTEAAAGGMRKAAFAIADGDKTAEITVISLPPAAGDLLDNVNRWRNQLGLAPIDDTEIETAVRPMQIGDTDGHYIELMSSGDAEPAQASVVAMVSHGGAVWFFKLTGDAALVQREETNFETFVESVKFSG